MPNKEEVSELRVLRSAAGYYVGREYREEESDGLWSPWFPYSRDSAYFNSKTAAQKHMEYLEEDE